MRTLFRTRPTWDGASPRRWGASARSAGPRRFVPQVSALVILRLEVVSNEEDEDASSEPQSHGRMLCGSRGRRALATSARLSQQVQALKRANDVRCARAALKRGIAAGRTDVSEVLLVPPLIAEKMALGDLLMSQRGWGHVRSERFLRSAGLIETKTLGSLTVRQRLGLAALLTNDRSHLIGDLPSASQGNGRPG